MRKLFFVILTTVCCFVANGQRMAEMSQPNVVTPILPANLDFAGEKVPLDNYDTRESLQFEMVVTSYMHSKTLMALLNTKRYFAIIEPIMVKKGVPSDFKYLCMAESGLVPDIRSSASAGGLWQIMPATGKEQGLFVTADIDERYNIEKSTAAACDFLLDSYKRFGSWTLAAAAYNMGNAGLSKRLETQEVNSYYDVFLPAETMRYIFRVLSFKVIYERPSLYGFTIRPDQYLHPLTDYHTVTISDASIDWSKFAKSHGTTYKMLRELNQWIRTYTYENKSNRTFRVKIPNTAFRKQ